MESVFVTVGTTSFDELVEEISSERAVRILKDLGYRKLILQIGRGFVEPKPSVGTDFTVEVYRFKDSIADDIRNATLVISHAGAGSCLEILEAGKPLIVVINEKLMNNHQLELAKQLHRDGHLLYCTCSTLRKTLQKSDFTSLKPFPSGHPEKFAALMDNVFGFQRLKYDLIRKIRRVPSTFKLEGTRGSALFKYSAEGFFYKLFFKEKNGPAPWRGETMQQGVRKYFGQKCLSEVTMDEYLSSQGLYRKLTAKDGSCLFRAVSEQLFLTQIHHLEIRKTCVTYMTVNHCKFETFIDGSYEKRMERLADPKEWAGVLEMNALSLMYNCDFLIYRYPGKPPTQGTNNGFEKKILLCCSNNGHYDSVFTKQFQGLAAVCQAVVYEMLYRDVFEVNEEELRAAVELFRSHGKRTRRASASQASDEAEPLAEKAVRYVKFDKENSEQESLPEEKSARHAAEEMKTLEGPAKMPFPFKVLKALDSEIYRNVEFDVWLDIRKEQQKVDYMVVSGRQYCLGDKCQVKLEQGGKYYNAHIQEAGQDGNSVTVFIEELAEKHTVPLTNLKPVTQVTPVPAWNMVSNRKGGSYPKIPSGYISELVILHLDPKSRRRFLKKMRGKQVFMAFACGRGQPVLPPRLQNSLPSGRSVPIPSPQNGHFVPYDQYRVPPPSLRNGRSTYAPSRSAKYRSHANRYMSHHGFDPDYIYSFPGQGKRCCQHYDHFTYRSRSYSRSRRPFQYVNKDCQYGYIPEDEESRAIEEPGTFYEIEEGNEAAYPAVHSQSASSPVVTAPGGYWVTRRGKLINSSSEDADEPDDGDSGYSDPTIYSAAEATANLTIQEGCCAMETPQDCQVGMHCSYSQQMLANSAVISASTCVSAASVCFSSNSGEASQPAVTYTTMPQHAMPPPLLVPSHAAGMPGPLPEMGEAMTSPAPPPYSCDPNGNDLPQDRKVVQYYFNLGLQCCHQSYWPSVVYMPPHQPLDVHPVFPATAQFVEHSPAPPPYGDGGRNDEHSSSSDTSYNGKLRLDLMGGNARGNGLLCLFSVLMDCHYFAGYTAAEAQPAPQSTVYYPVLTDQYVPQPLSTYDPCIPVTTTLHHVGPWYPASQLCPNSRIQTTTCPALPPPLNYVASASQPTHYVPH
ncbi:putative bifunctional UDP-N-acetylglucosamine transferase and deubiquitinase ALG13 [Leucoraja erinacea]|uniref:putative bifunctional UDP-N-acetylglucosamine transferase and deubiquitinase ALG13 n=1 Tax=Leucoraja erinaceus TaxID=7782 RepID=UPI002456E0CC|nr:putative bifunctional UDP-N-acetylglucosamine transferase and deubiquitinase ALG13 [Leucoraja erinacea]